MLPSGYRLDFDTIFVQAHDKVLNLKNVVNIPINFAKIEPKGVFVPLGDKEFISIIIGGDDDTFKLKYEQIKKYLDEISQRFKEYNILITTSPRTPKKIESLVKEYDFFIELSAMKIKSILYQIF